MPTWFRRHGIFGALLWAALALATTESVLLLYYLSSWLTLPLL
jgi:hypothetical protein